VKRIRQLSRRASEADGSAVSFAFLNSTLINPPPASASKGGGPFGELLKELLGEVRRHMSPGNRIRMRCVCRQWWLADPHYRLPKPLQAALDSMGWWKTPVPETIAQRFNRRPLRALFARWMELCDAPVLFNLIDRLRMVAVVMKDAPPALVLKAKVYYLSNSGAKPVRFELELCHHSSECLVRVNGRHYDKATKDETLAAGMARVLRENEPALWIYLNEKRVIPGHRISRFRKADETFYVL
jgi:hypothetical protein